MTGKAVGAEKAARRSRLGVFIPSSLPGSRAPAVLGHAFESRSDEGMVVLRGGACIPSGILSPSLLLCSLPDS